jgi:ADP-ribose pyrophosphatase
MKPEHRSSRSRPLWQTISSRMLIQDKWLRVRADVCLTPDGQTIDPWYVLEYPNWVNCMVIDENYNVVMLNHYRHGIDRYIPEIVAGGSEPGESPEQAIKRELLEETGYEGGDLYRVGETYANASNQPNTIYSFLAIGGSTSGHRVNELGANFSVEHIPLAGFKSYLASLKHPNALQTYHFAAIMMGLNFVETHANKSETLARADQLLTKVSR